MRICRTPAIEVVLTFTPVHILVETIAKRTTLRMIEEEWVRHIPQPPEGEKTWDMPRDDLPWKISFVKGLTKLSIKIGWDKDAISLATPSHGTQIGPKQQKELE